MKPDKGFSLVEVLMAVAILTLVGVTIYTFQEDVFSFNRILTNGLTAQDEARRALRIMSAEIRTASPSSIGAYPIAEATNSSFTFYSNIGNDALKERIRYFLDGTVLKRGVIRSTGDPLTYNAASEVLVELVHGITNGVTPVFTYYDSSYDGTTLPLGTPINIALVRLVKVTLSIDPDLFQPPGATTLTTQISIRNLKDNL